MRLTTAAALVLATAPVLVQAPAGAAAPTCFGQKATIVGNAKANEIHGTPRRDVIAAGAGNDVIRGLDGDDLICGGEGADRISGGGGNDQLAGDLDAYAADSLGRFHKTGDILLAGSGDDVLHPGYDARPTTGGIVAEPDRVSYVDAPAPAYVDLRLGLATVQADGNDQIVVTAGTALGFVGTPYNDVIHGTWKDDRLWGMGGDDQVFGHDGDDRIQTDGDGSAGADLVDGGAGADSIRSAAGYDTIAGGSGADSIASTSVNRLAITGGRGRDVVSLPVPAEAGFKVIGGSAPDRLVLNPYPDPAFTPTVRIDQKKGVTSISRLQAVTFTGKFQNFTEVSLPSRTKTIYKGSNKGDIVTASPDTAAVIKGRAGADVLTGSNLKDTLVGGKGFDIGLGKNGKDRCFKIEKRHSC
ncbi:hypothetical protein DDE18_18035 [Nocardioides gansuensis]|uniref:Calcium-binding protein n=1 Tax=Nocardioides gansuensis TaxID=2138300 RepID=A0A2T8F6P6_9ACTN|nr:calcium-binding protein [Nocardioides gansuensis]PVG81388.1 hypothetical protein DDE18_18035 [Nocardioides gansuensis]